MKSTATTARTWDAFDIFRCLVVVTQATTILMTWPLWQVRTSPPMLPAVTGPAIDFGMLLLASLAIVLWRPKLGVILHSLLLLIAMLLDQMRLQPEFLSQAILLWGTLPSHSARMICRAHLLAVWFFGGFHKLTSPMYFTGDARWLVNSFVTDASQWLATSVGMAIALTEIALAILALIPSTRRFAVGLAYGLHLGIVIVLSPLGVGWDEAVWPWNVALAMSGFVMIGSWKNSLRCDFRRVGVAVRAAMAFILIGPLTYYVDLLDPYLCHLLYSNHVPVGSIHAADGRQRFIDTRPQLKVPVPQARRLYEAYFVKVGHIGDKLEIADPRIWMRGTPRERWIVTFEELIGIDPHPVTIRKRPETRNARSSWIRSAN